MIDASLRQEICKLILEETIYLRHYEGEVISISDPAISSQDGHVKVKIDALGYDTDDKARWASPRFMNSLLTPKVGDILDCSFMEGDIDRLCYYGKVNERKGSLPKSYDGKETNQVIFEDPDVKLKIYYDSKNITYITELDGKKITEIKKNEIILLEGSDNALKFIPTAESIDEIKNDVNTLKGVFSGWTPVPNDGGAALKGAAATWYANTLTKDINNAKVDEVKLP